MHTDPENPAEKLIAAETAADLALAKRRGARVVEITTIIHGALDGHGLLRDQEQARVVIIAAVCDAIYPFNASIDIPARHDG